MRLFPAVSLYSNDSLDDRRYYELSRLAAELKASHTTQRPTENCAGSNKSPLVGFVGILRDILSSHSIEMADPFLSSSPDGPDVPKIIDALVRHLTRKSPERNAFRTAALAQLREGYVPSSPEELSEISSFLEDTASDLNEYDAAIDQMQSALDVLEKHRTLRNRYPQRFGQQIGG